MKKNLKSLLALVLVIFTVMLSACASVGLIKSETDESGTMTAHLYSKKGENGVEYCLSLLGKDEVLDMEAEPNIHKSETEFDFDWSKDMLAVMVEEADMPKETFIEKGDFTVVFGQLTGAVEKK